MIISPEQVSADYLIVGSGAMGMAFADTLLTESDATMIIVDRFAKPGGHWNIAYPFVTLHQPSAFYGVSSKELSTGHMDSFGLNKGLGHLATLPEIRAYFDTVMRDRFIPSGRVQYFPLCDYRGDGAFENILTGKSYKADFIKHVDATWLKTSVPANHTPNFTVEDGATFIPLNDLPMRETPAEGYNIIGGGKTGIDAILWLLEQGVEPDKISWVLSRDAWLINRKNTQPTVEFFADTIGAQAGMFEAIAGAAGFDDMFDRLEACGYFLRLDPDVRPSMFHGATISEAELAELQKLKNIIRHGRVSHVGEDEIAFTSGAKIPTSPGIVHVDCSASAIKVDRMVPVFQGDLIVPQTVRSYQPVFSASVIAYIETLDISEDEKNKLMGVVPLPNSDVDFLYMTRAFMMNQYVWGQNKGLRNWISANRLDGFGKMVRSISKDDEDKQAILLRMRNSAMPAVGKLNQLIAEIEAG